MDEALECVGFWGYPIDWALECKDFWGEDFIHFVFPSRKMRWSWTFPLCLAKHDHQYHQAQDFHVRDSSLLASFKWLADNSCPSFVLSLTAVSRRPQEAVRTDTIRNKSLGPTQPSLNGSSSPVSLHKPEKRLVPILEYHVIYWFNFAILFSLTYNLYHAL